MSRSIKLHSDGREEYEGDEPMRVERYDQAEEIEELKRTIAGLERHLKEAGIVERRLLDTIARLSCELEGLKANVRGWADRLDPNAAPKIAREMMEAAK